MRVIGRTPWAEWDDTHSVMWDYSPVLPEDSPAIEQNNDKFGKTPICLIQPKKVPSLFDTDTLAKARRKGFKVV